MAFTRCLVNSKSASVQATTTRRQSAGWRSQSRTGEPARSAFRRSAHSARPSKSSPLSESIVVTHPFHPLVGERLAVLFEKSRPGAERVLVCEGGPAGRVTLPVSWTDRAPARQAHRLAIEGLAELMELKAALEHPPLAKRGQ